MKAQQLIDTLTASNREFSEHTANPTHICVN